MNLSVSESEKLVFVSDNQVKLAKAVGITHASMSRFESGALLPSPQTLYKIAEVLGVTTGYLMAKEIYTRLGDYLEVGGMPRDEAMSQLFDSILSLTSKQVEIIQAIADSFIEANINKKLRDIKKSKGSKAKGRGVVTTLGRVEVKKLKHKKQKS